MRHRENYAIAAHDAALAHKLEQRRLNGGQPDELAKGIDLLRQQSGNVIVRQILDQFDELIARLEAIEAYQVKQAEKQKEIAEAAKLYLLANEQNARQDAMAKAIADARVAADRPAPGLRHKVEH
jgi:hypothetical protein